MRRIGALLLAAALAALFLFASGAGGDSDSYEVRAIFDNAGFLVTGEEVRIAGAKVGSVTEVDVTLGDEAAHVGGEPDPGKAVVVMEIEDRAFQDFRRDASCLIRPQSLIGEKFVECQPTQPRAGGAPAPAPLEEVPAGEPGEGQRFLGLERNGKAVDLDLVNNVMKEPYPDRLRLILNDLGAGLAARGEELAEIVERSNPALRETNRVLALLARQNRALAGLASDSDTVLGALARERESVASFINQANTVGEATAERRADLEETLARFPGFLRELRSTMAELEAFGDAATPVFADLGAAAPSLTRATRLLEPFSTAGTTAFETLGDAAEESAEPLAASDPVVRQLRGLGRKGKPATRDVAALLSTLRKTDGFRYLLETIFGLGGTVNAFDQYGHLLRALIPLNVCFDYTAVPQAGCSARFAETASRAVARGFARRLAEGPIEAPAAPRGERADGRGGPANVGGEKSEAGGVEDLLEFMLGDDAAGEGR